MAALVSKWTKTTTLQTFVFLVLHYLSHAKLSIVSSFSSDASWRGSQQAEVPWIISTFTEDGGGGDFENWAICNSWKQRTCISEVPLSFAGGSPAALIRCVPGFRSTGEPGARSPRRAASLTLTSSFYKFCLFQACSAHSLNKPQHFFR